MYVTTVVRYLSDCIHFWHFELRLLINSQVPHCRIIIKRKWGGWVGKTHSRLQGTEHIDVCASPTVTPHSHFLFVPTNWITNTHPSDPTTLHLLNHQGEVGNGLRIQILVMAILHSFLSSFPNKTSISKCNNKLLCLTKIIH